MQAMGVMGMICSSYSCNYCSCLEKAAQNSSWSPPLQNTAPMSR